MRFGTVLQCGAAVLAISAGLSACAPPARRTSERSPQEIESMERQQRCREQAEFEAAVIFRRSPSNAAAARGRGRG